MPSLDRRTTGRAYWRSLDELADTPEFRQFLEGEFPSLASDLADNGTRRQFLKLMGASFALAGLTGCRWPKEEIAPFANRPEGRMPGARVQYATAMELGGVAAGLLVTAYDGRPVKIEGNPLHPINRGSCGAWAQASVLEMYDPERATAVRQRQGGQWFTRGGDDFAAFIDQQLSALRPAGGDGLYVLSEASSSPSVADMRRRLLDALPQAKWHEYEPVNSENERRGTALAFGSPYRVHLALERANVIVSLGADLLLAHPASLKLARDFAAGRRVGEDGRRLDSGGPMNRLYVVESRYSTTGSMADHRYPAPEAATSAIAARLARELRRQGLDVPGLGDETLTAWPSALA